MGPVLLASYPRSGNSLLRAILWQCFGLRSASLHPNDLKGDRIKEQWCGHMEHRREIGADGSRTLRCDWPQRQTPLWKTHNLPPRTPEQPAAIYAVRDGREACVSFWHYLMGRDADQGRPPTTLTQVIEGDTVFGGWSGHLRAWHPLTRPNTLLLRFEDLRPAPDGRVADGVIDRLAERLGVQPAQRHVTPFGQMQQADPRFFRAGTNTTWRQEMSAEHVELFWRLHGEQMQAFGYQRELVEQ